MSRKKSQGSTAKPRKEVAPSGWRQHNFTIQLSLDEMNKTRQLVVNHVQSEAKEKFSNWEPEKLIDFIEQHTGVHSQITISKSKENTKPNKQSLESASTELIDSEAVKSKSTTAPSATNGLMGTLHLRDLSVLSENSDIPVYVLPQGQPYLFRLTLDLTKVVIPDDAPLKYKVNIIAKPPGRLGHLVGKDDASLEPSDNVTISLTGINLPPDIYRLEALVTLSLSGSKTSHQPGLMASLKSGSLEVY